MPRVKAEKAQGVAAWKKDHFDRRCAVVWQELLESKSQNVFSSHIEEEDFKMLGEVEQERLVTLATLERIKREQIELEDEIQTYQVPASANERGEDVSEERGDKVGKTSHLDCPYCGVVPSGSAVALSHHFTTCFNKFETSNAIFGKQPMAEGDINTLIYCDHFDTKTSSYCKKLKASCAAHSGVISIRPIGQKNKPASETMELCGARVASPHTDNSSSQNGISTQSNGNPSLQSSSNPQAGQIRYHRCRTLRRECPRHFNWENFSRRQLELQLISHIQLAEALQQEAAAIKEKMILARLSRGLKGTAETISHLPFSSAQSDNHHMDINSPMKTS
jgi:hypothetical protein